MLTSSDLRHLDVQSFAVRTPSRHSSNLSSNEPFEEMDLELRERQYEAWRTTHAANEPALPSRRPGSSEALGAFPEMPPSVFVIPSIEDDIGPRAVEVDSSMYTPASPAGTDCPVPALGTELFATSFDSVLELKGMLEYPIARAPPNDGPFIADVLCTIFLFVADKSTLLAVSSVNRMWRFYANYLPHWTMLNSGGKLFSPAIPRSRQARAAVENAALPRDEIMVYFRVNIMRDTSTAFSRFWCTFIVQHWLLPSILTFGFVAAHAVLAWRESLDDDGILTDVSLGVSMYFTLLVLVVVEGAFILGSARYISRDAVVHFARAICTVAFVSFVLLVPLALVAARYTSVNNIIRKGSEHLLSRESAALQDCRVLFRRPRVPSFLILPAPLADPRWRHYPTNKTIMELSTTDANCIRGGSTCLWLLYDSSRVAGDGSFDMLLPDVKEDVDCAPRHVPGLIAVFESLSAFQWLLEQGRLGVYRSFRVVQRENYFSAEPFKGAAGRYFSKENTLWESWRVLPINPWWGETVADAKQHVEQLVTTALSIVVASAMVVLLSIIAPLLRRHQPNFGLLVMAGLSSLSINPIVLTVIGVMCLKRDDDPRDDDHLLMCDASGGTQILALSGAQVIGLIVIFLYRKFRCCGKKLLEKAGGSGLSSL